MLQESIDQRNKLFWNELCGSSLARRLGIRQVTSGGLRKYDETYMRKFPYLNHYLKADYRGRKVLEVGLGYGTLGQIIASRNSDYYAMDIAFEPVRLMQYRLSQIHRGKPKTLVASVLNTPFKEASFNYVYSIGCLHHTGNLQKSIDEIYRILVSGGKAIIMLYNRNSLRYWVSTFNYFRGKHFLKTSLIEYIRRCYDKNSEDKPAPYTDFTSQARVRRLFKSWSKVKIDIHKINQLPLELFGGKIIVPDNRLSRIVLKEVGSDLYITVWK